MQFKAQYVVLQIFFHVKSCVRVLSWFLQRLSKKQKTNTNLAINSRKNNSILTIVYSVYPQRQEFFKCSVRGELIWRINSTKSVNGPILKLNIIVRLLIDYELSEKNILNRTAVAATFQQKCCVWSEWILFFQSLLLHSYFVAIPLTSSLWGGAIFDIL